MSQWNCFFSSNIEPLIIAIQHYSIIESYQKYLNIKKTYLASSIEKDHSNQKECEGYDDSNGHEREVIVQGICLFLLDTEYFQLKAWFKQVLQHLFTRNRSLNNAFKQM